jgi:hypothetical protein
MSISNKGGHGVTSVLAGSDHTVVKAAQPNFMPTQGFADHQGSASGPKGASGMSGNAKKKFPPSQGNSGSGLAKANANNTAQNMGWGAGPAQQP